MPITSAPSASSRSASVDPMKPATPVTNAFTRTSSSRVPAGGTGGRCDRAIRAPRVDHRQRVPFQLHFPIAPAGAAQQIGAAHLEPDEVVRVVHDAHLV